MQFGKAVKRGMSVLCAGFAVLLLTGYGYAADEKPTFVKDKRNGKKYRTVKLGNQTWMAQNLNYPAENSVCYDNKSGNCSKYGRLYTWDAAKNACPAGWHLPSNEEWTALAGHVGGTSVASKKLKSVTGWDDRGNGTDNFEFTALPGGYGDKRGFHNIRYYGYWWSATESNAEGAWNRSMDYYNEHIFTGNRFRSDLFSVRCVQD